MNGRVHVRVDPAAIAQAVRPATDPAQALAEAVRPLAEAVRPATDPAQALAEAVRPLAEAVRPATDLFQAVAEAVRPVVSLMREAEALAGLRPGLGSHPKKLRAFLYARLRIRIRNDLPIVDLPVLVRERLRALARRCREVLRALAALLALAPAPTTLALEPVPEAGLPPRERLIRPLTLAALAPPRASGRN